MMHFTLLHNAFSHLNKQSSFVHILFIEFSSAFNTIQPYVLALKLHDLNIDPNLTVLIVRCLINRTQSVCFQSAISSENSAPAGVPQGTVLAPVLFSLNTNDCRGTDKTPVIKCFDDSGIEDLSSCDTAYLNEVAKFCSSCKDKYLGLISKKRRNFD